MFGKKTLLRGKGNYWKIVRFRNRFSRNLSRFLRVERSRLILLGAVGVGKGVPGGLDVPDLAAVLGDRPVGAELPGAGNVHDGHLGPLQLVLKWEQKIKDLVNLMQLKV